MSTFSADLKLELIGTGEASGTWGEDTNNNLNLIQQAIAGVETVTLSSGGTLALAMTNKTISNARNMVIKFTTASIAASTICTVPDSIEKFYIFDATGLTNPTNLQIKTASGTGFTLDQAKIYAAYTDGTNLTEISLDTLGGTVAAANITGTIATSQIADDAVTLAKMAPGTDGNIISYDASGNPVAVATGTSGQVLTSAGAGAPPTFADAGGGAISWQTAIKTGDFTAVSGEGYFANTTSGAITMTLPASPSVGDIVSVKDYAQTFDSNALTVGRNSQPIEGGAFDLVLTTEGAAVTLVYGDSTKGWQAVNSNEITNSIKFVSATGGTTTTSGDFKIHTFTGPGTFTVNCGGNPAGSGSVDYLVLAGGGGGNPQTNGGGGAGGYRESSGAASGCYTASPLGGGVSGLVVSAQSYPITVGAGGGAGPGATSGSNSVFSSITSAGGGHTDTNGGSGGGSATAGNPAGVGNTPPVSPPQGTNGGTGMDNKSGPSGSKRGGGGGGALVAALNQPPSVQPAADRAGGAGATSSITASPVTRGGGGGGGSEYSPSTGNFGASPGGAGGGGNGGIDPSPGNVCATAGGTNLGGGGGGGGDGKNGAAGGSGIVIIRYKFQ